MRTEVCISYLGLQVFHVPPLQIATSLQMQNTLCTFGIFWHILVDNYNHYDLIEAYLTWRLGLGPSH